MNIEKLQMCRLCLVEDVRMFNVTNKDLQTLYEKLTDVPFLTEDSRPMLACVFCYTKLKQCCQLQRKCLETEKMLTEMLNKDHETKPQINKDPLEYFSGYVISPTVHVNCVLVECQSESNDIKEELPDDREEHNDINEIKEEHQTEFEYQDSCLDLEDMTTNYSESDSEDDTPVMEFKIEEETDVFENKRRAEETQSPPGALKKELYVRVTRLEDTITVQQKKTEQNTRKRMSTARSKLKILSKSSKSISNIMKNTTTSTQDRKKTFFCDVCQHSFTTKSKLKNHFRIHDEKPYNCDICLKKFTLKSNLKSHIRVHSGEKPFKCKICQRSFSQEPHLKRHHLIHTGGKPYECEICQRSFSESSTLKSHIRIHTGEKPYKCEICQRSFSESATLITHIRIHTGEKPYKCEICQRSFSGSGNLKSHIRIHTGEKPYKCDLCRRSFSVSSNLKSHIRIHTGEKPYKCEICQRSFSKSYNLKSHIRIHTGEKPY